MRPIYYLLSLISIFILNAIHASEQSLPLPEERIWLTQFFKDLLLYEGGIYTLLGEKPITIVSLPHYTQEEIEAYHAKLSEDERKKLFSMKNYSLPQTWDKWKKINDRYQMKRFLLNEFRSESNQKVSHLYFVNILQTANLIEDHYENFRKEVEFDFDPLEVVLQLKQETLSEFWLKISKNSYLSGLLLGYGKANAYAFHRKYSSSKISKEFFAKYPSTFSRKLPQGEITYSIDDFEIPMFVSFAFPDEIVEKYQKKKKQIQELYKGKDFLDFTLQVLID